MPPVTFLSQAAVQQRKALRSFFSSVRNVIMNMIHFEALDKILKQILNSWSQADVFLLVLAEMAVNELGFIAPIKAFVRQCSINAMEKELN